MLLKPFSALVLPILLPISVVAFDSTGPLRLKGTTFEEHYLDKVPVSGTALVGIQYPGNQELSDKGLWALLPSDHPAQLCISVVSDDGRYWASETFRIDPNVKGWVVLDFPTGHLRELVNYGAQKLALLGILRQSCGEPATRTNDAYVPLSWSSRPDFSRLSLLINSGSSDVQIFPEPSGPLKDCDTLGIAASRIAFDTHCVFDTPTVGNHWSGYFTLSRVGETPRQFHLVIWTHR